MTEQTLPPAAPQPASSYAAWGDRALAYLLDVVYEVPPLAVYLAGVAVFVTATITSDGDPSTGWLVVAGLLSLVGLVWGLVRTIRNRVVIQGRTGQSWGKKQRGIYLMTSDGRAPGWASCLARQLLHSLINQALFLDYLWPLWDEKGQTLTDKILDTIVVVPAEG